MAKGQRLKNSEIDDRVKIKLDKSIRKEDKGVNGLMTFGENNDYPQVIEKAINGSVTAKAAANIYAKFLTGQGFENEAINNIQVGTDSRGKKITMLSLLRQACMSVANNNGFYVHCNENLSREVVDVHLKPFKNCRFAKPDDTGYSAKILVYDNWDKDRSRRYKKEDIKEFNVFNLDDKVFTEQINNVGGIEKFKGQIYFQFLDNDFFYPLSPFDSAFLDCDTEDQISLFKNRTIRNGFFDKTVFSIIPGGTEEEQEAYVDKVKSLLGPDGDTSLVVETDVDDQGNIDTEKAIKIDTIKANINDKLFENWEKNLSNNIRKAVKGIPAILIDYEESSLGTTSGEAIIQATNYYNALTKDDRSLISEAFEEIFKNFKNDLLKNNENWEIKELNLIDNGTTIEPSATAGNQDN
jgi:hypothetical protein